MRDIKFRAWHKGYSAKGKFAAIEPRMLFDDKIGDCLGYAAHGQPVELMELTPMTEYFEKPIYESDIVKFHYFYGSVGDGYGFAEAEHELTGIVEMGDFGWGLRAIKGEHWAGHTGYKHGEGECNFLELCAMSESSIHAESFTVLGNIYENPELL